MSAGIKVGFHQTQAGPLNLIFACLGMKDTLYLAQRVNKYWRGAVQALRPTSLVIKNDDALKLLFCSRFRLIQEANVVTFSQNYSFTDTIRENFSNMWSNSLFSNFMPRHLLLDLLKTYPLIRFSQGCSDKASEIRKNTCYNYQGDWQDYAVFEYNISNVALVDRNTNKVYYIELNQFTFFINFFPVDKNKIGIIDNRGNITIWNMKSETGKPVLISKEVINGINFIKKACYVERSKSIYVLTDSETLLVHSIDSKKTLLFAEFRQIFDIQVSHNYLLCCHFDGLACYDNKQNLLWNLSVKDYDCLNFLKSCRVTSNEYFVLVSNLAAIQISTGRVFLPPPIKNMVLWGNAAIGIKETERPVVVIWHFESGKMVEYPLKMEDGAQKSVLNAVCSDIQAKSIYAFVSNVFDNNTPSQQQLLVKTNLIQLTL